MVNVKNHVIVNTRLLASYREYEREVNSYHRYAIIEQTLGDDLEIMAKSHDAVIEAITHKKYLWLGIMWHPEREEYVSDEDSQLIKEHFEVI